MEPLTKQSTLKSELSEKSHVKFKRDKKDYSLKGSKSVLNLTLYTKEDTNEIAKVVTKPLGINQVSKQDDAKQEVLRKFPTAGPNVGGNVFCG